MTPIYSAILADVRAVAAKLDAKRKGDQITAMRDDELLRRIIYSFRDAHSSKGLRLTKFGSTVLKGLYECHVIDLPEKFEVTARHLIYLDNKCRLPYYIGTRAVTMFDINLAFKLTMADGNLTTLMMLDPI